MEPTVSAGIHRLRKLLRNASALIDVEILYECVGLEKFLCKSSHGLIVDFPCKPRIALKSRGAVQVVPTEPRIAPKNQGVVPAMPLSARP